MNNEAERIKKMQSLLAVALFREPADLILKNARLVNVISGEIVETNLAVKKGLIAALGIEYVSGEQVIDLDGKYLSPGLIDAHLHVESTLLFPTELSRLLVVNGTTAVINDPHEIANVLGIRGVELMLEAAANLPCDFFSTVPSCVPATAMETAGSELTVEEISLLLTQPRVVALGEMMNYPGVISADPSVLAKLAAAQSAGKPTDGHAPAVIGKELQAYLSCGISTDHECISVGEALEKINSGMKIIIRHGSASSSLEELLPLVNWSNIDSFMFGSDDRDAAELLEKGHLNHLLRKAVALGADPLQLLVVATINPARHYRLFDRGVLAPGYLADMVVFDDLNHFRVNLVMKAGKIVAEKGNTLVASTSFDMPSEVLKTVHLARAVEEADFNLPAAPGKSFVIGIIPGQLVTSKLMFEVESDNEGLLTAEPENDLNKIAVVERHRASGRIAVALVKGFGLREGALASSVAHDSHNIIVVGVEEKAMASAVNELAALGGGFVAVDNRGRIRASLALPVAGLMSTEPAAVVAKKMGHLLGEARSMGTALPQPFLTLSFLALPVIPSLKLTDRGLFDVDKFAFL